MQCVILAAGLGTRMRPLTNDRPKPLVEVCGTPLIEHIVRALPPEIDELIIVVGYRGDMIRVFCGDSFLGRRVQYVEQVEQKGTAHALWLAKDLLRGKFLFMYADDIHGAPAFTKLLRHDLGMLVARHERPQAFGVIEIGADDRVVSIEEKPDNPKSNFINPGGMLLDERIFSYEPRLHPKGEYFLTDLVSDLAADYPLYAVEQDLWIPVSSPEDVAKAEAILCPKR